MNALQWLEANAGYYDSIDKDRFDFPVLIPRFLSFSDYDNSCYVERSNYEAFLKDFGSSPWVHEIYYGCYGKAIALHPNALKNAEIKEALAALENYPLLDEELYSSMVWEAYLEAWADYGASDLRRNIVKEFNLSWNADSYLDDVPDESLREFYESKIPSGEYYQEESGGIIYIRIDAVTKDLTRDDVANLIRLGREARKAY